MLNDNTAKCGVVSWAVGKWNKAVILLGITIQQILEDNADKAKNGDLTVAGVNVSTKYSRNSTTVAVVMSTQNVTKPTKRQQQLLLVNQRNRGTGEMMVMSQPMPEQFSSMNSFHEFGPPKELYSQPLQLHGNLMSPKVCNSNIGE
jgi:hypothetical protein